ncbi:MAG: BamA/TamA family outer membrane protein [Bacteroidetes bacterium]|nr:BamA/TamA family outer membrane protein [Bacteroidota bacterium]
MGRRQTSGALLLLLAMLFIAGCNVTKDFPPGQYLLIKNKFKVSSGKVSSDDLSGYLQQEPNSKLFGLFRTNIAFYNAGSKGKETKFKKWMRTKPGTAPVLLDSNLNSIARKQMSLYLANKGYFNATVKDSVIFHRKKATVVYLVKLNTPYTIRSIKYAIADTSLAKFVCLDTAKTLIHQGQNYDMYLLDAERTRITTALMNHGYYHFSNLYVHYRIDSTFNRNVMDITKEIRNPVVPSLDYLGTFIESKHERYTIGRIMINPDYSLLQSDSLTFDTLVVTFKASRHDTTGNTYYFLYKNKMKLKPRTLSQMIFLKSGTYYNLNDVSQTYSQLAMLQVFNYTNIQMHEAAGAGLNTRDKLDCKILLSRAPVHSFSVSTDVTNSAGAFGLQGSIGYMNRNLFRGAQLFRISLNGAAQMQASSGDVTTNLINTIELGITTSLTFPQFLFPIRPERVSKKFKPRTTITLGYNFQRRIDYDRHISNISFGYSWNQNEKIKHMINPVEITMVKIWPDSTFTAYLNSLTDKRLKNQYTNHLVAGLKYTFTYTGQDVQKVKDFFYIRSNFETGGNLIYAVDEMFKVPKTDGFYTLFNIPYSQFVRPDMDVRFYHFFNKTTSLVSRVYAGFGVPYGNSISLPFEKAFFAGGSNDIRGWKMGTLGPGHYHNDTLETYDQTGDMQLQFNLEYRFPVYKYFRSAFFMDLGNVWLLKETPDLPGGKFELKYFWDDTAIDLGVGIRADFDYFIVRFDPAVPIKVPYYFENNHWYVTKLRLTDIIWNFGIGYPF